MKPHPPKENLLATWPWKSRCAALPLSQLEPRLSASYCSFPSRTVSGLQLGEKHPSALCGSYCLLKCRRSESGLEFFPSSHAECLLKLRDQLLSAPRASDILFQEWFDGIFPYAFSHLASIECPRVPQFPKWRSPCSWLRRCCSSKQ
jgi:hypothetical protein